MIAANLAYLYAEKGLRTVIVDANLRAPALHRYLPVTATKGLSDVLKGALPADELADTLGLLLPDERDYETAAGMALEQLRHLPETGEKFRISGWQFEIIDMDGRKIDKLLASRVSEGLPGLG